MSNFQSLLGRVVSHFRIVEELGHGAMGVVFKAKDIRLHRFVALKFLRDEDIKDPAALERFRREARVTSALEHPNICTVYEVGEQDGRAFIAMQLLEGATLEYRISEGEIQAEDTLRWVAEIANALVAAHAKGTIHRDIKPSNIFVTKAGHAKLLDFGLASLQPQLALVADETESEIEAQLTRSGLPIGTIPYMSPEQARGEKIDARTDIFSLGAVLYEMVTQQRAFPGSTAALIFDGVLNRRPAALTREQVQRCREMAKVIDRALMKDRELRYQSAVDLLKDLYRVQRNLEYNEEVAMPSPSGPSDQKHTSGKNLIYPDNLMKTLAPTLTKVMYSEFYPVDLVANSEALSLRLRGNPDVARLAAPVTGPDKERTDKFIASIVEKYGDRDNRGYWELLNDKKYPFAQADSLPHSIPENRLRVLSAVLADSELEKARRRNVENYLLTHTQGAKDFNPFHRNGGNLALVGFSQERFDDLPVYSFNLRRSDYFTYRTIAECSDRIRGTHGLDDLLGGGLTHYLERECQELVHGGFGFAIMVRTAENELVVRRRSGEAAKYGDDNRWYMSTNEGLRSIDDTSSDPAPGSLKSSLDIVKRMLRNELVGDGCNLDQIMKHCWITGALLYLPNLVVNPCFLVALDLTNDEISVLAGDTRQTRHWWEFEGEPEFVKFTRADIASFINKTRIAKVVSPDGGVADTWDEGSLVTLALAAGMAP